MGTRSKIFWLSFVLLFAEILAVRWLGIEIPVVQAFPNLVVMVALVAGSAGMGAASVAIGKAAKAHTWLLIAANAILILTLAFAVPLGLPQLTIALSSSASQIAFALLILFVSIACLYIVFRQLGYALGVEFEKLPPLEAYSVNLAGSIAGVVAFGLISWFCLPPWVALAIIGCTLIGLYRNVSIVVATVALAGCAFFSTQSSQYSAYSKLDVIPMPEDSQKLIGTGSYILNSNNHYFHFAIKILEENQLKDLYSEKNPSARGKILQEYYRWFRIPFTIAKKKESILVLGAGSGNDVAFALSKGAKSVHAVEIDPVITKFGSTIHPDRPYLDPRVVVHNEDARSFLRYSPQKFDLIEFAYLDPGNTLHTSSFLRVDNYVYTVEAMKAALRHLNEGGMVSVTFATGPNHEVTKRLYQTIAEAWGRPPLAYVDKGWDSVLFVFGPGAESLQIPDSLEGLRIWPEASESVASQSSTDDWPFLYLQFQNTAVLIYIVILLVAIIFPALILTKVQDATISKAGWGSMFFLGQSFMLIETKSITQLSLIFGATWLVSSIVIALVLLLAYIATIVVKNRKMNLHLLYVLLFASLLLEYFYEIPASSTLPPIAVASVSSLIACLPIMFGSMIFSTYFKVAPSPAAYFSANLLGVSIGGLTENLCIVMGLRNLTLVAAALYCSSYFCAIKLIKRDAPTSQGKSKHSTKPEAIEPPKGLKPTMESSSPHPKQAFRKSRARPSDRSNP